MRRLLGFAVVLALTVPASTNAAFPPLPQPAPPIPSAGLSEATWSYGYVPLCCVSIPPNTVAVLTTVTVGPGTWAFTGSVSVFIDPKLQSVPWSLDLHKQGGTAGDYYAGSTGRVEGFPAVFAIPIVGVASFTERTAVELRFTSWAAAHLVPTAAFDSGPTTVLVAQRLSDFTVGG